MRFSLERESNGVKVSVTFTHANKDYRHQGVHGCRHGSPMFWVRRSLFQVEESSARTMR